MFELFYRCLHESRETFLGATLIDAQWTYDQWDRSDSIQDSAWKLPNQRPPFNRVWCEWNSHIDSDSRVIPCGVLIYGHYPYYTCISAILNIYNEVMFVVFDAQYKHDQFDSYVLDNDERWTDTQREAIHININVAMTVASFTFSLMTCSNVVVLERYLPRTETRRLKRHNVPIVSYKTVQIDPKRTPKYKEFGSQPNTDNPSSRPLHYVRGHFAEYGSNGKGLLFGRYSGRFWIPAHIAGDPEQGLTITDYRVTN